MTGSISGVRPYPPLRGKELSISGVLTMYTNHLVGKFIHKHFITDVGFMEGIKDSKIMQLH